LNQFIVYAVSEKMGALNLYEAVAERLIARIELQNVELRSAVNEVFHKMKLAIQEQADTQEHSNTSLSRGGFAPYMSEEVHNA